MVIYSNHLDVVINRKYGRQGHTKTLPQVSEFTHRKKEEEGDENEEDGGEEE